MHRVAKPKSNSASLLILVLFLSISSSVCRAGHSPNELFVKVRGPVYRSSLDGALSSGSVLINELSTTQADASQPYATFARLSADLEQVIRLSFRHEVDLQSLFTQLGNDPDVEWVAYNNQYRTVQALDEGYTPSDEFFNQQPWLRRISAPLAWEITRGSPSIIIGIIDTGIDHTHRDLRDNIWRNPGEIPDNGLDDDNNGFIDDVIGWDFVDAPSLPAGGDYLDRDNDPMDDFGHGTYVAGCAAGSTDNGVCYASVGFGCRLMPLRAGNANGTLEEDDIAAAVLYGTANGARIINMSFGDVVASPFLREVVQIAHSHGVVLTASAGNANNDGIHYPSGFPEVISVGATDTLDRRASFSNYGPSVDIMAPGDYISSTILGGECGQWVFPSGTSYAAPIVAGVAGLVLSVDSTLQPDDLLDILRSTADDLGPAGWDPIFTSGRVNARRAVEVASFGADAIARIHSPRNDSGVRDAFVISGTASGAAFNSYSLEFGVGENPTSWQPAASGNQRVFSNMLGTITAPQRDTVLVVRLKVRASNGNESVDFVHLYVQNDEPTIDSLRSRLVLDADGYAQQILAWTNQFTSATLLMTNTSGDSIREDFGYVSDAHVAVISQERYRGDWTATLRVTNLLGESALSAAFPYSSVQTGILPFLYSQSQTTVPHGVLGSFTSDYDCDSRPELWVLPVNENLIVDTLEPYEWSGSTFIETEDTYGPHIPQAWGDADGDGLFEMAARRFVETRIWEQSAPCGAPSNIVLETFSADSEFVISRFVRVDSASGRDDILARIRTSSGSRMALFSVSPNYAVARRVVLPNTTTGQNNMGPPGSAVGDLDRDGLLDVIYGDYDGDIIWCEWNGSEAVQVYSLRLRQNDATNWMAIGDFDGDGEQELIAGCRSNAGYSSESQRLLQGWDYYIFESFLDNELAAVDSIAILGNENVSVNPASVLASDLNNDGRDEIIISSYPDLYIISYNNLSGRYEPVWHDLPSKSGAMTTVDLNGNGVKELIASNGTVQLRIESTTAESESPFPPRLFAEPLNESEIRLFWTPIPGAVHYEVYRALSGEPLQFALSTQAYEVVIQSQMDVLNDFAVLTYDTAFPVPTSAFSNLITIASNAPPLVHDVVEWPTPTTIAISFSESMGPSISVQGNWRLEDGSMPAVILESEAARKVYLSFDTPLTPGEHELTMRNLRDAQGTALPESQQILRFALTADSTEFCYVLRHSLSDGPVGNHVEIVFSEAMSLSVEEVQNYTVIDARRQGQPFTARSVRSLSEDRSRVEVELDPRYPAGSVGVPVRIELRNMESTSGKELAQTTLLIESAAENLDAAYVYPNPFRRVGAAGSDGVYFAGLPMEATIRIFTLSGVLIKTIEHKGTSGHASWDLHTQDGDMIASGVYLYKIEANGSEKLGKLAVAK